VTRHRLFVTAGQTTVVAVLAVSDFNGRAYSLLRVELVPMACAVSKV
jgi:hypothetical protein